jgi:hypothetical protein
MTSTGAIAIADLEARLPLRVGYGNAPQAHRFVARESSRYLLGILGICLYARDSDCGACAPQDLGGPVTKIAAGIDGDSDPRCDPPQERILAIEARSLPAIPCSRLHKTSPL